MSKILYTLLIGIAGATHVATSPPPQDPTPTRARSTEEFAIDAEHSSVVFRVMHLSASAFWGRFNEISGSFQVDDDDLENSFLRIEVPAASVDTHSARRDRHLKSQDFFSAKEFPVLSFTSTEISKTGNDSYRVTGKLTLRGKTREISIEAHHTGTANVLPRFGLRCGYETEFEIDRTDFGIDYGAQGGVLGKTVRIIIALEGKLPQ